MVKNTGVDKISEKIIKYFIKKDLTFLEALDVLQECEETLRKKRKGGVAFTEKLKCVLCRD